MKARREVWQHLHKNPHIFIGKVVTLLVSVVWFAFCLQLFHLVFTQAPNNGTKELTLFMIVALYFLVEGFILFVSAYHLYQKHIHQGVAYELEHSHFLRVTGMSLFLYSALGIPLAAIAVAVFNTITGTRDPFTSNVFLSLMILWLALVSWRMLFVAPKASLDKAHHFVFGATHMAKLHLRHTISAWIVVVASLALVSVHRFSVAPLTALEVWFATMAALLIIVVEVLISVWESIVVFETRIHTPRAKVKKTPVKKKKSVKKKVVKKKRRSKK